MMNHLEKANTSLVKSDWHSQETEDLMPSAFMNIMKMKEYAFARNA